MFIPHLEVVENISDYRRTVWKFSFMSTYKVQLIVGYYSEQSRATKRHNWRAEKIYNYLDGRGNDIKAEDVPLPQWVKDAALDQFVNIVRAMPVTVTRDG